MQDWLKKGLIWDARGASFRKGLSLQDMANKGLVLDPAAKVLIVTMHLLLDIR
jgi:hypothetical protein